MLTDTVCLFNDKNQCRRYILNIRNKLSKNAIKSANLVISDKVLRNINVINADEVLIYASYNNEVDTFDIIKKIFRLGKKVAVPKVIDKGIMEFYYIDSLDELENGYMGIPEPTILEDRKVDFSTDNKKVIICPGVAFDRENNRIGYGGGFYDRYLYNKEIYSIAIAYRFQVFKSIPIEPHDCKVDALITN